MTADARDRLRRHLFEELIPFPREGWPADDVNLFEIGLDSVRVMRLLVFLEEEFEVRIPEEAITPEALGDVRGLLALIENRK